MFLSIEYSDVSDLAIFALNSIQRLEAAGTVSAAGMRLLRHTSGHSVRIRWYQATNRGARLANVSAESASGNPAPMDTSPRWSCIRANLAKT
jgi:hypothetical protein